MLRGRSVSNRVVHWVRERHQPNAQATTAIGMGWRQGSQRQQTPSISRCAKNCNRYVNQTYWFPAGRAHQPQAPMKLRLMCLGRAQAWKCCHRRSPTLQSQIRQYSALCINLCLFKCLDFHYQKMHHYLHTQHGYMVGLLDLIYIPYIWFSLMTLILVVSTLSH